MEDPPADRLAAALAGWVGRAIIGSAAPWSAGPAAPGAAYGVVGTLGLVAEGGLGISSTESGAVPTANTVFRIASMTKSFTAAAVLALRDRGTVGLDDPITRWVPGATGFAAGGLEPPTLDRLLRMAGGLAEDDPLGDRLQSMGRDEFAAMTAEPVVRIHPQGMEAFEYSNYGYALLGQAITIASGMSFMDFITHQFLEPLRMTNTTWAAPDGMAGGYVWRDGEWLVEPVDGPGAFAAMGGLFSCVADIAKWVSFLMGSANPEVLSVASRRDLQVMRTPRPAVRPSGSGHNFAPFPAAYGYGLNAAVSPVLGPVVWHSGGYPGFGSSMLWLPRRRVGVVILMNGRYAPATRAAFDAVHEAIPADTAAAVEHPDFAAIRGTVTDRLEEFPAGIPVAMNVELDEPVPGRQALLRRARTVLGGQPVVVGTTMSTPVHGRWRVSGERGDVEFGMMLTATDPLRLTTLDVDIAPHLPRPLDDVRRALTAVWNAVADGATPPELWEALGVARSVGPLLGEPVLVAGDGKTWARWRVATATGAWLAGVAIDEHDYPAAIEVTPD